MTITETILSVLIGTSIGVPLGLYLPERLNDAWWDFQDWRYRCRCAPGEVRTITTGAPNVFLGVWHESTACPRHRPLGDAQILEGLHGF